MRTTTRSSERWARLGGLALLLGLGSCVTRHEPAQFFELSPESPAHRAAQIRYFETDDSRELQSASAAVLQDLGFHIEESVRDLGFLRAAKERSAREYGQEVGRVFAAIFSFGYSMQPVDLQQKIAATIVARPDPRAEGRYEVRVMFYRVVWSGQGKAGDNQIPPGQQRMEMIRDPTIYQQFFAKLSQAVFLEAFTL